MKFVFGYLAVLWTACAVALGIWAGQSDQHSNVQTIYVRNLSSFVSDKAVARDLPAFQQALSKDFAPIWHVDAHLVFIGHKPAPDGSETVDLLNNSDVAGALAYHTVADGLPMSKIFIATSRYYGYDWTVGFTHELWEMLADPNIISTVQAPTARIWAQEIADPCEADNQGFSVDGVQISDFVTPNWFGARVRGPYDFMNHIQAPYVVLSGGYAQWWNGSQWVLISKFRKVHGHTEHYE